jgi:hypothetical protein
MIIPNSRLAARIGLTTLNESPTLYHAPREASRPVIRNSFGAASP